ncbi:putative Fe-S protein [Frankia sp. CeD]|nr:putative Fe-S protein [Frankia sp. CeD]
MKQSVNERRTGSAASPAAPSREVAPEGTAPEFSGGTVQCAEPPFEASLRDLAEVLEPRGVQFGMPDGPGWADCAFLTGPAGVAEALARVGDTHGASPEVAASYLANWYSANVTAPAIACFVLLHRVPALTPATMSLRVLDGGWFDQTAFHRPAMTVLADDPIAGGATAGDGMNARIGVVGDVAALRGRLVEEVLAHLQPFVEELRGRVRLGLPALWGAVAAQCARAFLLTERATGDPHLGRVEADAFFSRATPTIRARPRWHEFVHHGRRYTGIRRGSCCLAYRLGDDYCTSCPFTGDQDREERLRAWIDTQGNGGLAV